MDRSSREPLRRLTSIAFVAAAALGFGGCGEAALQTSKPPKVISPARTVIFDCAGHAYSRPSGLVLTCADAGDELVGLHWIGWGRFGAYARGSEVVLTCVPNCASGHTKRYPVVVVVSGLTLSGSDAAYRRLVVNYTSKRNGSSDILPHTRYTLARTGPALDTSS
jgi:hypothetical protein